MTDLKKHNSAILPVAIANGTPTSRTETLDEGPALGSALFGGVVEIHTLITTLAVAMCSKKPAFWHFAQVEFVQEFTSRALLAKTSEPMFAYGARVCRHMDWSGRSKVARGGLSMSVGAADSARARSGRDEVSTELGIRIEFYAELSFDKGLYLQLHMRECGIHFHGAEV